MISLDRLGLILAALAASIAGSMLLYAMLYVACVTRCRRVGPTPQMSVRQLISVRIWSLHLSVRQLISVCVQSLAFVCLSLRLTNFNPVLTAPQYILFELNPQHLHSLPFLGPWIYV